jgi:hypothetical protein
MKWQLDFGGKAVFGHMEQTNCIAVLVHKLPTGKTQIKLQKLCLYAFQFRETTVCGKHGRQCHLNDMLQVIIGKVHYAGQQVYFE